QPWRALGSHVNEGAELPNPGLTIGPHSPLAAKLVNTQSGLKLPLRSNHGRAVLVAIAFAGDRFVNAPPPNPTRNLPHDPRIAVLPFPNTSKAAPTRAVMSL